MAENEVPERIWLTPQFADAATVIGGGIYHANLSEKDREGCTEYVRADLAAPDAAQNGDLVSRSAALDAIGHHLAYYKDHYMHCLTRCVPELIEKLPAANPDAIRQARRETWEKAKDAIVKVNGFHRFGHFTVKLKDVIAVLEAAALRAEGEKGE